MGPWAPPRNWVDGADKGNHGEEGKQRNGRWQGHGNEGEGICRKSKQGPSFKWIKRALYIDRERRRDRRRQDCKKENENEKFEILNEGIDLRVMEDRQIL